MRLTTVLLTLALGLGVSLHATDKPIPHAIPTPISWGSGHPNVPVGPVHGGGCMSGSGSGSEGSEGSGSR